MFSLFKLLLQRINKGNRRFPLEPSLKENLRFPLEPSLIGNLRIRLFCFAYTFPFKGGVVGEP